MNRRVDPRYLISLPQWEKLRKSGIRAGGAVKWRVFVPLGVVAPPGVVRNLKRQGLSAASKLGAASLVSGIGSELAIFFKENPLIGLAELIPLPYIGKLYSMPRMARIYRERKLLAGALVRLALQSSGSRGAASNSLMFFGRKRACQQAGKQIDAVLAAREARLSRTKRVLRYRNRDYLALAWNPHTARMLQFPRAEAPAPKTQRAAQRPTRRIAA